MARFIKDRKASKGLVEKELKSIEEVIPCKNSAPVSWININGIHDLDLMKRLGEVFEFHPLFMEDILNTDQRPRFEDGDHYNAFILKMLKYDEHAKLIKADQFTLILGKHYVLTLQEETGDVLNPVRERIRIAKKTSRLHHWDEGQ